MKTESPTIIDKLTTALRDLGPTEATVAATLTAAGITGLRDNGARCPVNRWLTHRVTEVTGLFRLTKGDRDWLWLDPAHLAGSLGGQRVLIPTPPQVAEFMWSFDHGAYPHLIEWSAVAA